MFKLTLILSFLLLVSACTSVELNANNVKQKVQPGMSQADALALFDFPEKYEKDGNMSLMVYGEVAFYFIDDRMVQGFELLKNESLKSLIEKKDERLSLNSKIPNDLRNKIIFSKNTENHVTPYQAFAYLNDEAHFIEAVKQEFTMDYYSTTSNALCVAIAAGFIKATEELIKAGAYIDANLKDAKTGRNYIKARDCTKYLSDEAKRAQISKLLNSDSVTLNAEEVQPLEKARKNQVLDSILEWLKPVVKKNTTDAK
jgi:hypothetical protein